MTLAGPVAAKPRPGERERTRRIVTNEQYLAADRALSALEREVAYIDTRLQQLEKKP